jgi:hypothetical protein
MASAIVAREPGCDVWIRRLYSGSRSVSATILLIIVTASIGNLPEALSAESMTASAPS